MEEFIKKIRINSNVVLIAVVFFIFGTYVGFRNQPAINMITGLNGKEPTATTTANTTDFAPFWKVWNTIDEKYPDAKSVSSQDRVYGAISGLLSSLNDPYSVFFRPEEAKMFQDEIAGSFGGIGVEVGVKNKILTVIAPIKDTPGYKAGLKPGDKILKIDKTITSDLSIDKAIKLIRGEKGTVVILTIFREGDKDTREIKIIRDTINIPTLDTEMRPDGVFVIRLYSFSANSADLFRDALKKFTEAKTDKLVLDLRGNPGGYLDSAVDISSWFLPNGKVVVTEDYGNEQKPTIYRSRGYNIFSDKLKFVILIDNGSASASEIVAGAMHDQNKAKLVGTQSYGKGSVQEVIKVTGDTIMKVTVAKWLTPDGTSISKKGLTPDFIVDYKKIDDKNDTQMNKAIEVLNSWK